jgi:hypothetical protein
MHIRLKVKLYPVKLHALAQCSKPIYPQHAPEIACGELTSFGAEILWGAPTAQTRTL